MQYNDMKKLEQYVVYIFFVGKCEKSEIPIALYPGFGQLFLFWKTTLTYYKFTYIMQFGNSFMSEYFSNLRFH